MLLHLNQPFWRYNFIYLTLDVSVDNSFEAMEPDYIRLKEIKPAIAGYISEARTMFEREAFPDDDVIHDVRVLMKKARAALKLVAPQLDKEYIEKDIIALREVGRKMCTWRETSVLRKNLKELRKEFPDIFARLADNEKITFLLKKPENVTDIADCLKEESIVINELLRKTGFRIRFESMNKIDPHLLVRELELTYGIVVDIYLTCRNNPRPEELHEFRKKAKDFLYQLCFFRPLNPPEIKSLEKRLDNLTQTLGRYNDLTQLVRALDYEYSRGKYAPALDELVIRIREKQDTYLSKIWPAGYKIFCPGRNLVNVLGFKVLVI
jgi:CHAD domain-containing protein